ncbi:MAG: hypothetical protein J5736_00195 [Bacilli bacterium]|nr:hypothetical protein [Bacilli bacterium]
MEAYEAAKILYLKDVAARLSQLDSKSQSSIEDLMAGIRIGRRNAELEFAARMERERDRELQPTGGTK